MNRINLQVTIPVGIQWESKPPGPHPPLVDLMINGLKTWSFHLQVFMCERSVPDENEPQKNGDSFGGNRSLPTIVILGIFYVKHVGLGLGVWHRKLRFLH